MSELPPAARRVEDAARALGLDIAVRIMPDSTRTAAEAAAACGCAVDQIVKSLIFRGRDSGRPVLLLVAGGKRVDEAVAAGHVGEPLVRPEAAFVREATGFAIGGIPPFGHAAPVAAWMDRDLLAFDVVWAAAGTPRAVFAVAPQRLAAAVKAPVVAMA